MKNSERYANQAEAVQRLAVKAGSDAEREVYLSIAEGWRKLAAEADRNERHDSGQPERRTDLGVERGVDWGVNA